ncbi:hypothetical protein ABGV42_00275 [Paenibacillus pabuli]|uniref:hypothetical protein n=1 Tax=Paenibacillus pabuli TaxID=1472 RepID=UPI003242B420
MEGKLLATHDSRILGDINDFSVESEFCNYLSRFHDISFALTLYEYYDTSIFVFLIEGKLYLCDIAEEGYNENQSYFIGKMYEFESVDGIMEYLDKTGHYEDDEYAEIRESFNTFNFAR